MLHTHRQEYTEELYKKDLHDPDNHYAYQVQSKEMHVLNPSLGKPGSGPVPLNPFPLPARGPGPFLYT